jgi:hypothetical protein
MYVITKQLNINTYLIATDVTEQPSGVGTCFCIVLPGCGLSG